jgi:TonB family protein
MRVISCCLGMLVFLSACATSPKTGSTPSQTSTEGVTREPRPGKGFPVTEEFYPLEAKKLGETGVVAVRACVDTTGKLSSPPTVVRTSGSPRLDRGAIELAAAGSGHYLPAIEHGQLVSKCFEFHVHFY